MYCSLLWEWWRWRCGSNMLLLLSHNLFMLLHEIGETLIPPYHIGKNGTPNLRLVVAVFLSWVTCAKNCHPPFTIIILCFFFLLKSRKVEKKNNQLLLLKKKKKKYMLLSCPMRILSLFTVLSSPQNCFSSIKRWTLKTIVVGLSFAYGPSEYKVFHSNFFWKSNFRFWYSTLLSINYLSKSSLIMVLDKVWVSPDSLKYWFEHPVFYFIILCAPCYCCVRMLS